MGGLARVLVVEDDVSIAGLVKAALENAGLEVAVAHGGQEARARFDEFEPTLVMLDLVLNDVADDELPDLHAKLGTAAGGVVLMSVLSQGQCRRWVPELRPDRFLLKPFRL